MLSCLRVSRTRVWRQVQVQVQARTMSSILPAAPIPPAPPAPITETVVQAIQTIQTQGAETSLATIGMGGWSPVGITQSALEWMHVGLGVPWWGAIVLGTVAVRLVLFPVVLMSQRNNALMANNMPRLTYLQNKMTEAKQTGNQLDTARYTQEIALFMKERGVSPLKNAMVPFAQLPFFVSFFIGLRRMTNYPVESMQYGGALWFTDLTVPDQFYLLPIITSATLLLTIELGVDSAKMQTQKMQLMKYVFRGIPLVMLPFTLNFPAAILCYWASSNFMSLLQVGVLKIPAVRDFCKIPKLIVHPPSHLTAGEKKGFVGGVKEFWSNIKVTREVENRQKGDEMTFNKAGKGPLVKTYRCDPTKMANAVRAKGSR